MHRIIISPMIYNVKRIYICLSDIFKLFQDFSREIQTIIRPHTNSHTILRFTTKRHKRGKKMLQPYSARFLFLLVYIDEAHAATHSLPSTKFISIAFQNISWRLEKMHFISQKRYNIRHSQQTCFTGKNLKKNFFCVFLKTPEIRLLFFFFYDIIFKLIDKWLRSSAG